MNVLLFDIEASNLKADRGHVFCISFRWLHDSKILTFKINPKDPLNDKQVIKDFLEVTEQADVIVGWYSDRYDWPYVTSRALYWKLQPTMLVKAIDGWRIARSTLCLSSNRLETVSRFLGIRARKTHLDWKIWEKAGIGDPEALNYIITHCEADIRVLTAVYKIIAPLYNNHPRLHGPNKCNVCGGKLKSKGRYLAGTYLYQRLRCNQCGHTQKGEKL